MKRNNIFMWTYIVFIISAVILRFFIDFSAWNGIVIGITSSSFFFAFEELFSLLSKSLTDSIKIIEEINSDLKKYIKNNEETFKKINSIINNNDLKETLASQVDEIQEIKRNDEEYKQYSSQFDRLISIKNNSLKKLRILTIISTFLGCIFLFLGLAYASLFSMPINVQEIVTVVTFAIILLTRQISIIKTKKYLDDVERAKQINENFKSVRENMLKIENQLYLQGNN